MNRDTETVPARHETPDLAELRRLAEAVQIPGDDPEIIGRWWDAEDLALYPVSYRQDREFIQACSPDVVLALLAERDALAAKVERVRELHQQAPVRACPDCGGPLPAGHARCTNCKRKAGL